MSKIKYKTTLQNMQADFKNKNNITNYLFKYNKNKKFKVK